MTQIIVLFRYDGKWKNNEQGEPEWCSGLNGGYGAINFADAEITISRLKDEVYEKCGLDKSEIELKFSYSTHTCDHIRGPIYLSIEKCLLTYLLLGDTHHRPLLHVEIEKKVQIICENSVDNEFGSHGYNDCGGSELDILVNNNCRDDFVDSDLIFRRGNDCGGGKEKRPYLMEEKIVALEENMETLQKELENGREENPYLVEEEEVAVEENMGTLRKELEDGREEKKENGEKEEAELERDGMEIDNIVDKGESGNKKGMRRKEEGKRDLSGKEEWEPNGARYMKDSVFSLRQPRRRSCHLAKKKLEKVMILIGWKWRILRRRKHQQKRVHVGKKGVRSEQGDSETVEVEKTEKPKRGQKRKKKNEETVVEEKTEKEGSQTIGRPGKKSLKHGEEEKGGEKNVGREKVMHKNGRLRLMKMGIK